MIDFQHWPEATGLLPFLKKQSSRFEEVGCTPFEVLEEAGSLQLRKYQAPPNSKINGEAKKNPVLIIPSFINRSFILDLLPEKSFVRHFLNEGHDVYLIDWGIPKSHEQNLSLEALLCTYLEFLYRKAQLDCGGQKVHLVGHCIGGTIALISAILSANYFLSLTLLTAPVDFVDDDKLSRWVREPNFDNEAFVNAYGNIPWPLMQLTFLSLKPTQLWSRGLQFAKKYNDKSFMRNFTAMESWINDNVNLRSHLFLTIMIDLYQKNSIASGEMNIAGKLVDLSKTKIPVFVLISEEDHIVPASSHLKHEIVPKVQNFKVVSAPGGHVGALIGGRSQKTIWPSLTNWMGICEGRLND